MKYLTTLLLLFSLLLSVLASCQGAVPTASLPATKQQAPAVTTGVRPPSSSTQATPPASTQTPPPSSSVTKSFDEQWEEWEGYSSVPNFIIEQKQNEYEKTADGKHIYYYPQLDIQLFCNIPSVTDEIVNEFARFDSRFTCNPGAFIDYYCIAKEDYIEAMKKYTLSDLKLYGYESLEEFRNSTHMQEYALVDIWYSDNYSDHEWFLHPDFVAENERLGRDRKDVLHRYEPDTVHTNYYYTIPWELIEAVGVEAFAEYEEEFAGTENFNVLHFLNYFEIDEEEYSRLFPGRDKPHNPEYLYGSQEMQDKYFCRHPLQ